MNRLPHRAAVPPTTVSQRPAATGRARFHAPTAVRKEMRVDAALVGNVPGAQTRVGVALSVEPRKNKRRTRDARNSVQRKLTAPRVFRNVAPALIFARCS
eukprot:IDg13469t1